jgi:eukaryotic-like serine/threonine-protein kinase
MFFGGEIMDDNKAAALGEDGELPPSHLRGELEDVKCIAKGGMSVIFRARQPSLDRFVVVKRLRDELVGNSEMLQRFRREAKALASVLHQNVAHVYDFVETSRESYIVMEYIDGIDLSTVISKLGNVPPEVAAGILLGVARGVGYIHAHNLIHRDIKPSNIRLTNRGSVKLMDFGIVLTSDNEGGLTRPGLMVGSPSYLSPEQVLGDPLSHRADIFLLGIVLYEMLTGTRPFKEEGGETVFQRIRESKYVPAREMQSQVPSELDRILRRCLQKNPDRRYPDATELIADLERYLGAAKSSRADILILKHLDEEALLSPSFPYGQITLQRKRWKDLFPWPVLVATLIVGALCFWGGRRSASPSLHEAKPVVSSPPSKLVPR